MSATPDPPVEPAAADALPLPAKADPAPAPPPAAPAVSEASAKARPVAAIVNWILAAIAIAAAALILQLRWPWVANNTKVTLIAASGIGAFGIFMFLFDEQTKAYCRSLIGHPLVRYGAIALLVAEAVLAIVVLPPPQVVRFVPGPRLDERLAVDDGLSGRTMLIAVHGKRFELGSPPPRSLYASTDGQLALYEIGSEDVNARNAALKDIIENQYRVDLVDTTSVDKLIRHFTRGSPILMTAKGSSRSRLPTGTYSSGGETLPLKLSNVDGQGIDTYVVEILP